MSDPSPRAFQRAYTYQGEAAIKERDVVGMLLLANAGPHDKWAKPELCSQLATALDRLSRWVEPGRVTADTPDRLAWDAVFALRRHLPKLRSQWQFPFRSEVMPDNVADSIAKIRADQLAKLDAIDAALEAYFPERPENGDTIEGSWHNCAFNIWTFYKAIVGSGSKSANSSAVKFVLHAMSIIGWGRIPRKGGRDAPLTADAISKALRRHGDKSPPP